MVDGRELVSIIGRLPAGGDVNPDLIRAIRDIETLRGRPCICYAGSMNKPGGGIDASDDVPFQELIRQIPADQRNVDVLLSTPGGHAGQVARFVDFLRNRFDEVDFLLPAFCMSAGTLFALSGDHIWMNPGACLGPTDPQFQRRDGRLVPAQALLLLIERLRVEGEKALAEGKQVPWTTIRTIDTIDKGELAEAGTASDYSTKMAAEFLKSYKFRHWQVRRTSGENVTDEYRAARAQAIADALASHERWKNHGHAISREVLKDEIQLEVEHPDADLERLLRRFWALMTWVFDSTSVVKALLSTNYIFFRQVNKGTDK